MGMAASLNALDSRTCEAFEALDPSYWPSGKEPEPFHCRLDKEWHMLHFVLTGTGAATDAPLGILFDRGPQMEIVSEYCCAVSPAEMRAFDAALSAETHETMRARFDLGAMARAEVYNAEAGDDEDHAWDYITQNLDGLRQFAGRCSAAGCGALVVIA